ncbi:MAG: hypothetical protein HZA91_04265 [Verrucomicrobia bacterium]|nr:hypothetical protein [Verrucomicrobiota bacterium]
MSFDHPIADSIWSLVLLVGLVTTGVYWWLNRSGNHWAYTSLSVALVGAFPAAAHVTLPASWLGASPLMSTVGAGAGTLSMLIGALAWGLSAVAWLTRMNWKPVRDIGGIVPTYLGGFLGFSTAALALLRLLME